MVIPYIAAVADAVKAAGLIVTETWTEAVVPMDHVVEVAAGPDSRERLHLVWSERDRWLFIHYAFEAHGGDGWHPDIPVDAAPARVAELAVQALTPKTVAP